MNFRYAQYTVPALGALCVAGAVGIGLAMRSPLSADLAFEDAAAYDPRVPGKLELPADIPSMEQVVEKHLFVKERKASGANTFPDLVVKGIYVGERQSAVLSLKSRPEINLRIWKDDVNDVVARITDPRDVRKPIIDFLNEWDVKEITFSGLTVEHFTTGEVETYPVNYTPEKKIKDNAEGGYGQGAILAQAGGRQGSARQAQQQGNRNQQAQSTQLNTGQMMRQLRDVMQQLPEEQRDRILERLRGDGQNNDRNNDGNDNRSNRNGTSSQRSNSSSRNGGNSRNSGGGR